MKVDITHGQADTSEINYQIELKAKQTNKKIYIYEPTK